MSPTLSRAASPAQRYIMTLLLLSLHVRYLHPPLVKAEALRGTRQATCRVFCHVLLYKLNSS